MVVSVEETRVNTENECEKPSGESDSSTDRFTSDATKDTNEEELFSSASVNGVKSTSVTLVEQTATSPDFTQVDEKEKEKENVMDDCPMKPLLNGINHVASDGVEEGVGAREGEEGGKEGEEKEEGEGEEKEEENIRKSDRAEMDIFESECGLEVKSDGDTVSRMEIDQAIVIGDEMRDTLEITDVSKDVQLDEAMSVEKNESTNNAEKLVPQNLANSTIECEKWTTSLKLENTTNSAENTNDQQASRETDSKIEEPVPDKENDDDVQIGKKIEEAVEPENNISRMIDKKLNQTMGKESPTDGSVNISGVGIKRRAEVGDEAEPDRDGGISSSSSSSSSSSGSETENAQDCKRIRFDESIFEEDERERLIREFVERSTESSEEIGKNCDKLQHEIAALSDLARDKELEWNSIMRLLKLKEEMLERILFKKRHLDCQNKSDFETNFNKIYKNLVSSSSLLDQIKGNRSENTTPTSVSNHVTVVPISSSTTSSYNGVPNASSQEYYKSAGSSMLSSDVLNKLRPHRPILPKPPSSSCSSLLQQHVQQPSSYLPHSLSGTQSLPPPVTLQPNSLIVDQNSVIGEGRQGPIVDVKSIIADFRSKNPDSLPRRGRRNLPFANRLPDAGSGPRFIPNTALLSMANMALGSGSHVRTSVSSTTHNDHRPNSYIIGQDGSVPATLGRSDLQIRSANIDSLMLAVNASTSVNCSQPSSTSVNTNSTINANNNSNNNFSTNNLSNNSNNNSISSNNINSSSNSFQEALVKFAKMNEKRDISSNAAALHIGTKKNISHLPPPPPYPEVTLHPVLVPQSSGSPPVQNSLLHGILTKSNSGSNREHQTSSTIGSSGISATTVSSIQHRPTTFSPTLAKLLTAPERSRASRSNVGSTGRNPKATLSEILNSKKSRTEVTITPVTTSAACSSKTGSDVVLVEDDDESEATDRLVIDEGREVTGDGSSNVIPADQVPECQGCHKKAAQFVCAGCGNQWYCSRECQVQAWEDHSEMCSG